jgi:hypothetical protein
LLLFFTSFHCHEPVRTFVVPNIFVFLYIFRWILWFWAHAPAQSLRSVGVPCSASARRPAGSISLWCSPGKEASIDAWLHINKQTTDAVLVKFVYRSISSSRLRSSRLRPTSRRAWRSWTQTVAATVLHRTTTYR